MKCNKEVREALKMMRYEYTHSHTFNDKSFQITATYAAYMKFFGALLTESINVLLLVGLKDALDCVMNFVALVAIAEFDNYYLEALGDCEFKKIFEDEKNMPTIDRMNNNKTLKELSLACKVLKFNHRVLHFFYVTICYYFLPVAVVIISFILQSTQ